MVAATRGPDHRPMTTEQPFEQPIDRSTDAASPAQPVAVRHLRRRTTDRVIGGVAGGLGDYLNVDPILLRAGFAGLMIFGGAGLVLYVLGWLLIPAEGQWDSIFQAGIRRVAKRTGRLGLVVVIFLAVFVLTPWILNGYDRFYVPPEMFWALAVALIGIVLLLPRDERATPGIAYPPGGAVGTGAPGETAAGAWAPAAPAVASAWERSPLGWYILAGALLAIGVLAVVATAGNVRVLPGQFFGGALLALGIGLVIGSWWGRARLVGLLGILVLPFAAGSAFLTVPLEGGIGKHDYRPVNLSEVQPAYHLVGGDLTIDLGALGAGSTPVHIQASVGVGGLYVVVPRDATVEVTSTVQGGELWLFGRDHVGTGLSDHVAEAGPPTGPTLILTLDAGIGEVWVERAVNPEDY